MNRQQRRQAARQAKNRGRAGTVASPQEQVAAGVVTADLEAAIRFHRAGDLDRAAQLYRRVLHCQPDQANALHLLGLTTHQSGQHQTAAELIGRALAVNPNYAEAHNNMGAALIELGQTAQAIMHLRRALALKPDVAETHKLLGMALHTEGRFAEAAAALRRALALNPSYAKAHGNLGVVLVDQGKTDQGLACHKQALALDAEDAEIRNNLGSALKTKGLFAQAVEQFEAALAIDPAYALAYKNLASCTKVSLGDPLIPRLARRLREGDSTSRQSGLCHFALAKCLDDVGRYDEAFRHYKAGNDILGRDHAFDIAGFRAEVDRMMSAFTAEFLAARAPRDEQSERPVFIVGMPRSGTTLVEQILASHPEVTGAGELTVMNHMVHDLAAKLGGAYPDNAAQMDGETAERLADRYLGELRVQSPEATRVTDKMPNNFRHLGLIAMLFPRARIIHCRRDPMDVCLSCYFQDFAGWQPFAYNLSDLGHYYRQYERLTAHWRAVLPMPMYEVRYEDLVADKERISHELIEACGLQWDRACLAHHETERAVRTASDWQVRQPVYNTSVGRWRRYEKHLGPLREALVEIEGAGGSTARSDDRSQALAG